MCTKNVSFLCSYREQQSAKEESERRQKHAVEEMMKSKEKANKFLSRTMQK